MEEASCPQRSSDYAYANPVQVTNSLILILFYSYIYLVIYLFSLTFIVFSRVNWRWIHDDGIRSLLPRGKLRFRLRKPRTNNKFFLKIWSCSFHLSLCLFIYLFIFSTIQSPFPRKLTFWNSATFGRIYSASKPFRLGIFWASWKEASETRSLSL